MIVCSGQVFSKWTVLHPSPQSTSKRPRWMCRCECGDEVDVLSFSLTSGKSRQCKRCSYKSGAAARTKHGHAKKKARSKEFIAWSSMMDRCRNPRSQSWTNYGGRGIAVASSWQGVSGFDQFLKDIGRAPAKHLTLERVNNDGHYEPNNCIWATRRQQNHNKRGSGRRDRKGQFIGTKCVEQS